MQDQAEIARNEKPAIHGRFYNWVAAQIRGGYVLDAGCGDGDGTMLLSTSADCVMGIDNQLDTTPWMAHQRNRSNVLFLQMDCQEMALPSSVFDYVVANALFEYLPDIRSFMHEVHRVLKPGGSFICGTKNLELSLKKPDGTPLYSGHLQEFTPSGLYSELGNYFAGVRLYGEYMKGRSSTYIMNGRARRLEHLLVSLRLKEQIPLSLRSYIRRKLTGVDVRSIGIEDFEIVENKADHSLYVIGRGVK